jgi:acyl carrier protein
MIAEFFGVDVKDITPETRIADDLEADSVDAVEVVMLMEEGFDFKASDEEAERVVAAQDVVDLVRKKTKEPEGLTPVPNDPAILKNGGRRSLLRVL